jgi:hypothetical protein
MNSPIVFVIALAVYAIGFALTIRRAIRKKQTKGSHGNNS